MTVVKGWGSAGSVAPPGAGDTAMQWSGWLIMASVLGVNDAHDPHTCPPGIHEESSTKLSEFCYVQKDNGRKVLECSPSFTHLHGAWGKGCYLDVADQPKNFVDAQAHCRQLGGDLVSLETMEEFRAVKAWATPTSSKGTYFTSARANPTDGRFYWVNSTIEVLDTSWYSGEPDNPSLYPSVVLSYVGLWDREDNFAYNFVCEFVTLGFTLLPSFGCYLMTTTTTTWTQAQAECARQGGHLAAIETRQELEAIFEWMRNVSGPSHPTLFVGGRLTLGGIWRWGDAPCSQEVPADFWYSGEPDSHDDVALIELYGVWGRTATSAYRSLCEYTRSVGSSETLAAMLWDDSALMQPVHESRDGCVRLSPDHMTTKGYAILVADTGTFCRLSVDLTVRNVKGEQKTCDVIPFLLMTASYSAATSMGLDQCKPFCPGLRTCSVKGVEDTEGGLQRFSFECQCNDACADLGIHIPVHALADSMLPFDICSIVIQYHYS